MIKPLREALASTLKAWMGEHHPHFKANRIKDRQSDYRSAELFSMKVDAKRSAWIILGGTMDSGWVSAAIYWTHEGLSWDELDSGHWGDDPMTALTCNISLYSEKLVGDDLYGGSRLPEASDPPVQLQEMAIAAAKRTDLYQRVAARTARDLRIETPGITDEQIAAYLAKADAVVFKLWEQIESVGPIPAPFIEAAVQPVAKQIIYLLERYGMPFLYARLGYEPPLLAAKQPKDGPA